jgi:hypothetical protein
MYYQGLCKYAFAQRRIRLRMHFSERILVVNGSISVVPTELVGGWVDASAPVAAVESRMTEH